MTFITESWCSLALVSYLNNVTCTGLRTWINSRPTLIRPRTIYHVESILVNFSVSKTSLSILVLKQSRKNVLSCTLTTKVMGARCMSSWFSSFLPRSGETTAVYEETCLPLEENLYHSKKHRDVCIVSCQSLQISSLVHTWELISHNVSHNITFLLCYYFVHSN